MGCCCCVKGCGNKNDILKKDPNSTVSFHKFPTNPELKKKWLQAIGRPNWKPPNHARICSAHFSADQLNYDNVRVRIQGQACPVLCLPPNSNFEANNLEVCRICLAVDVKLHSLQTGTLATCIVIHSLYLSTINESNTESLPEFVCYECAALLIKSYSLVEKSMTAQATLLDIFARHGQVTKSLINNINRDNLNLTSVLQAYNKTPTKTFHYDEEENVLNIIKDEHNIIKEEKIKKETFKNTEFEENAESDDGKDSDINNIPEVDNTRSDDEDVEMLCDDDGDMDEELHSDHDSDSDNSLVIQLKDKPVENVERKGSKKNISVEDVKTTKNCEKKRTDALKPGRHKILAYFNIVQLSMQEQIEEWQKWVKKRGSGENYVYRCEKCSKMFAHQNTYRRHLIGHDPSHGPGECPVCKLRFKTDGLARSHAKYAHEKKLYCKSCPKVFNSVIMAKRHYKWHMGRVYQCKQCPFSSAHESALSSHMRKRHGVFGKQNTTADLSEAKPEDPLSTTCKTCGLKCESVRELVRHRRADHPHPKTIHKYPVQCEYCETIVNNGNEHWNHVRKQHPKQKSSYKALVGAVCDTCGKGCQTSSALQLHSLRHAPPSVPCPTCGRMFHDEHRLRAHARTHADARPHACDQCGRSFKWRGNLLRHKRVHTDVASYECSICSKWFKYSTSLKLHVRSVHYKIPPPPRKRKYKRKENT
ncbi:zinc finger protein 135-like isoform X2 [Pectinophora gossypiella]|uniref:THAP-type domain-containing protein n=1 Tax=Pectinophora gossypiella TaxID=13191 RepID=A0A1E1W1K0_PECGO|nr:zinc finger protein 135-like isoform X2 [Pectinophora gossypiella]